MSASSWTPSPSSSRLCIGIPKDLDAFLLAVLFALINLAAEVRVFHVVGRVDRVVVEAVVVERMSRLVS